MISVDDARKLVLALARPAGTEEIALDQGLGRTLANPAVAGLTQPPFNASAMDGYALRSAELPGPFQVIGTAAAGVPYEGGTPPAAPSASLPARRCPMAMTAWSCRKSLTAKAIGSPSATPERT